MSLSCHLYSRVLSASWTEDNQGEIDTVQCLLCIWVVLPKSVLALRTGEVLTDLCGNALKAASTGT